jgi:hypothetical protein
MKLTVAVVAAMLSFPAAADGNRRFCDSGRGNQFDERHMARCNQFHDPELERSYWEYNRQREREELFRKAHEDRLAEIERAYELERELRREEAERRREEADRRSAEHERRMADRDSRRRLIRLD